MAKRLYYDGRAFALGVVGAAALLATMAGEYLMHNVSLIEFEFACNVDICPQFAVSVSPTAVILPDGSALNITIYQVIVPALGAVIFVSALACAMRTTRARLGVLATAAALLALTLLVFRAQTPMVQIIPIGGCDARCVTNPEIIPFASSHTINLSTKPKMVDPFWFMVPAAALGLLATGIAFLPAARRRATA